MVAALLLSPLTGQSTSSISPEGNVLLNGQAFFPVGYYAESFIGLEANATQAGLLAGAGFNLIFTDHDFMSLAENDAFLDTCASLGIYNMIGFYDDIDLDLVDELKGKSSLLTWCTADDAQRWDGTTVQQREALVRSVDSTHLISGSEWYGFDDLDVLSDRLSGMDMTGVQFYPVVTNSDGIISAYDRFHAFAQAAAAVDNAPFGIIQTFRWDNNNPDARFPFPAEVRAMTYAALIAGVKGLMFYTLRDYDADATTNIAETYPEVWNETVNAAANLDETLAAAILNGQADYLSDLTGNESVYATAWTLGDETYLIVVNLDQYAAHPIALAINAPGAEPTALFDDLPATLAFDNGQLSGTLAPLEVQAFRFGTVSSTEPSLAAEEGRRLRLWPNPTNGDLLWVDHPPQCSEPHYLLASDVLGRRFDLVCEGNVVSLRGLPPGTYQLVAIYPGGQRMEGRFQRLY